MTSMASGALPLNRAIARIRCSTPLRGSSASDVQHVPPIADASRAAGAAARGSPIRLDAVRDDLIVAGEVGRDGSSRGLGHRDRARNRARERLKRPGGSTHTGDGRPRDARGTCRPAGARDRMTQSRARAASAARGRARCRMVPRPRRPAAARRARVEAQPRFGPAERHRPWAARAMFAGLSTCSGGRPRDTSTVWPNCRSARACPRIWCVEPPAGRQMHLQARRSRRGRLIGSSSGGRTRRAQRHSSR